ncbi:MAG TPA: putative molybdenum carrier protein, partial [Chthoniobacterales bacterium]|nr:putative molybdenum carrier protein [Chthoniobacterales bacterium]
RLKIISGGQTGVDRAALDAALSLGIECGGWCPQRRQAEDGIIPERYPLEEVPGGGYAERTARNVAEADGTLIMHGGTLQGGTRETAARCAELNKPCQIIDAAVMSAAAATESACEFVREHNIRTLNVAGPRASEWPQGYKFAHAVVSGLAAPFLSFIVPAHNEERELPETLRAIQRAGDQSRHACEIIVVDDASTDATAQIATRYGARVVSVNCRLIAAVRNAGARVARGEILFFIDADTRMAPEHIPAALQALDAGCAGGGARIKYEDNIPDWARVVAPVLSGCYFAGNLGAGGFLFTTRANFGRIGGFDESYYAGEEVVFSLALKKLGRFRLLPQPLITSGRKLRMHSAWRIFTLMAGLFLGGACGLRSRKGLEFWYDGRREPVPS